MSEAPSLRSTASNSSLGSSLRRSARTRRRSKSSPRPDMTSFAASVSPRMPAELSQLFGGALVAEPADILQHNADAEPPQYKPPPAAFSRVPSIPQLYDLGVRNSVLTQGSGFTQSGGYSSIYPQSTTPSASTVSGTESPPSPRSFAEQVDNNDVSSYDPEAEQGYDGDEVAYRLRLLVKNNYFLPPAHTKPSPSDFAVPADAKKSAKSPSTPTFFDIFRRSRSKSRSKPSTPTGGAQTFDLRTPALRTTSDSTTVSAYAQTPQLPRGRTSNQIPRRPGVAQDPSGRVVVVRERMPDIAMAAKQAEQEMKSRGLPPMDTAFAGPSAVDVIDPTDAVDLPPPSSAYPFAVQAAHLHEMGVQDSVGAALLADHLPPRSPGAFSADDDWRKDLLRAAVDYSYSSDVLASQRSIPVSPSSPTSPASQGSMLGRRIVSPPLSDEGPLSGRSSSSRWTEIKEGERVPRPSSTLPMRVETPAMPLTPLAPPPRKLVNPIYSISQTSLPIDQEPPRSPSITPERPPEVAPRLSDVYEVGGIRQAMLSPPLIRRESSEGSSHEQEPRSSSESEAIFYTDEAADVVDPPRLSVSSSVPDNRPSLSFYSQPSPTRSAFMDALSGADAPPRASSLRGSLEHPSSPSPVPRDSMASPPPRVSSSLAHFTPLLPPPRSSSLMQRMAPPSLQPPPVPTLQGTPEIPEILDPGPSTPPLPISERRIHRPLVLEIPRQYIEPSIRSAPPAPSSPPSFFDSIQSQPNAMDDLDSSSDEDEDSYGDHGPPPQRPPIYMNPHTSSVSNIPSSNNASSRSLLMRLGNHSTPYVSRSSEGDSESRKPVGNVPVPNAFFTERRGGRGGKSDQGHGPPTSTFEFYRYTQQHPTLGPSASASAAEEGSSRKPPASLRDRESLQRLDGLLIEHMKAEQNTMKRIATNLQTNARA